jgi:multidrug efflux pump subunit AcrA (membrane-fusion protein)
MAQILYRIVVSVVPFVLFFSFSCKPVVDPIVGSSGDTQIPNTVVTVDSTYIYYGSLYARGRVMNDGTSQITPPWYVECQFYSDSTFKYKLGGANTTIYVPLDPGQGTFWTVSFYSTNVTVQQYPNFKVKDQRAIYKKQN